MLFPLRSRVLEFPSPDLRAVTIPSHPVFGMREETHRVVITGGTGLLGRAIAETFSAPGWAVDAPGSRDLNVRDETAVREYFSDRPLDLLVCAAGITRDQPLFRLSDETWNETWAVNYSGALCCSMAVLPLMRLRKRGHIVFISSHSAVHPPVGQAAYAAAKAALLGLTSDLAKREGSFNIRINAIMPGFLETGMTETVTKQRRMDVLGDHVLGRFNTTRQAAGFIRFLHHEMPHTSGQVFQLDSRTSSP